MARSYTEAALNTLVGIMQQPKASPASRIAAAGMILEYGWGKPRPASAGEDFEPPKFTEIVRNFVDPKARPECEGTPPR